MHVVHLVAALGSMYVHCACRLAFLLIVEDDCLLIIPMSSNAPRRCYFGQQCLGSHDGTKLHCGRSSLSIRIEHQESTISLCHVAKCVVLREGLAKYEILMRRPRSSCQAIINAALLECRKTSGGHERAVKRHASVEEEYAPTANACDSGNTSVRGSVADVNTCEVQANDSSKVSSMAAQPKKRGRPKKVRDLSTVVLAQRKPIGRPRKVARATAASDIALSQVLVV